MILEIFIGGITFFYLFIYGLRIIIKLFHINFTANLVSFQEKTLHFTKRIDFVLKNNSKLTSEIENLLKINLELEENVKISNKQNKVKEIEIDHNLNKLLFHQLYQWNLELNSTLNLFETINQNLSNKIINKSLYVQIEDSKKSITVEENSPELLNSIFSIVSKFLNFEPKKDAIMSNDLLLKFDESLNDLIKQKDDLKIERDHFHNVSKQMNADLVTLNAEYLQIRKDNDYKMNLLKNSYESKISSLKRSKDENNEYVNRLKEDLNNLHSNYNNSKNIKNELEICQNSLNIQKLHFEQKICQLEAENKSISQKCNTVRKLYEELIIEKDFYKKRYLNLAQKLKNGSQLSTINNSSSISRCSSENMLENNCNYNITDCNLSANLENSSNCPTINQPNSYFNNSISNGSFYNSNLQYVNVPQNTSMLLSLPPSPPLPPQEIIDFFINFNGNCGPNLVSVNAPLTSNGIQQDSSSNNFQLSSNLHKNVVNFHSPCTVDYECSPQLDSHFIHTQNTNFNDFKNNSNFQDHNFYDKNKNIRDQV